jgi:hypothetical protein
MASFVLDRWTIRSGSLEARFTQGPADSPVMYVEVIGLEDASAAEAYFSRLEPFNEAVLVGEESGAISIQGEYAEPLLLRGTSVTVRSSGYESVDYERNAKLNENWGKSMLQELKALKARVDNTRHLLTDQRRRLLEKATRHRADSTVHQLYDQQVSFIDRLLDKLDS